MDLVEEFVQATEALPSPERFRRWAGLGMVSSLMSRRVWTTVGAGKKLHGNLFILLVGEPATGKSLPIREVQSLLRPMAANVSLAPAEVTPERLVQKLGELFVPGAAAEEGKWALAALPSEMGAFMPKPDIAFMQRIADLWDCPDHWSKETKRGDEMGRQDDIHYPYLTLLGGAQPAWINALISQDMLSLGLPSRVLFVVGRENVDVRLFEDQDLVARLDKLSPKLQTVLGMKGFIPFSAEAKTLFKEWYNGTRGGADGIPLPSDTVMRPYIQRRFLHIGKLALVYAAARHPDRLIIEAADLKSAMAALFDAERDLGSVLASAGGNPYRMREQEVLRFAQAEYVRTNRAVSERVIREALGKVIPSFHVGIVLEEMIGRGDFIDTSAGTASSPARMFRPRAPQ